MPTTAEDIQYWTARVAELERQLDAETKLSRVKQIAGELMRTRAALKKAKAKTGRAGQHPNVKCLGGARAAARAAQPSPQPLERQLRAVALAQCGNMKLAAVAASIAVRVQLVALAEIAEGFDRDRSLARSPMLHRANVPLLFRTQCDRAARRRLSRCDV